MFRASRSSLSNSALRFSGLIALVAAGIPACNTKSQDAPTAEQRDRKAPGLPPAIGEVHPANAVIRTELKGVFVPTTTQGPGPTLNGQATNLGGGMAVNEVVGAVRQVVPHPTDPNTVYLAAVSGGVWVTNNALSTTPMWTPLTDNQSSLSIGGLALDPVIPPMQQPVLLAGYGRNSSFLSLFTFQSIGGSQGQIILSRDGGTSWREFDTPFVTLGPTGEGISAVAVNQETASKWVFLVAGNDTIGGLYRGTWEEFGMAPPLLTWTLITDGAAGRLPAGRVSTIVRDTSDPANPDRVWADVVGSGIYFSNDFGLTWVDATAGDTSGLLVALTGTNLNNGQNTRNHIAVSRGTGRVFVSVIGTFRNTTDVTWIGGAPAPMGATPQAWTSMERPMTPTGNTGGTIQSITAGGVITVVGTHNLNNFGRNLWVRINPTAADAFFNRDLPFQTIALAPPAVGISNNSFQLRMPIFGGAPVPCNSVAPNNCGTWAAFETVFPGGQAGIHGALAADPTNAQGIVYVGGDSQMPLGFPGPQPWSPPNFVGATDFTARMFRGAFPTMATTVPHPIPSTQWRNITDTNVWPGGNSGANGTAPHADSRNMVFDSQGTLLAGGDGGITRLSNPATNTGSWSSMNGNLAVTEIFTIAFDARLNELLAGAQDTGSPMQTAINSLVWRDSGRRADGATVAVELLNATQSIRYFGSQSNNLFRETYSNTTGMAVPNTRVGLAFNNATPAVNAENPWPFYTKYKMNKVTQSMLAFAGNNAVWETNDRGANISAIPGTAFPNGAAAIVYGHTGSANASLIWIGNGTQIFTRTAGGIGTAVTQRFGYPAAGSPIGDIVLDNTNANIAYAIRAGDCTRPAPTVAVPNPPVSDCVHRTTNGGQVGSMMMPWNWTNITGDLDLLNPGTLRSIIFVTGGAGTPNKIYVGADRGLFVTSDASLGFWNRVGTNLPNALVQDMDLGTNNTLYIGTQGRGAWSLPNAHTLNLPPVARCNNPVTRVVGPTCQPVAVGLADVNNMSFDPDNDPFSVTGLVPDSGVGQPPGSGLFGPNTSTEVQVTVTSGVHQPEVCVATVQVLDQTPPVVTAPADQPLSNCGPLLANLGTATATDNCATGLVPKPFVNGVQIDSNFVFPAGMTNVVWTVGDGAAFTTAGGNVGTDTQVVTVSQPNLSISTNTFSNWWGTMAIRNNGPGVATRYKVEFDLPSGVHCTGEPESIPPGATLGPQPLVVEDGLAPRTPGNHCIFTWNNGPPIPANLGSQNPKVFNWSADRQTMSPPASPQVQDTLCSCVPESNATFCSRQGKCGIFSGQDNCGFQRNNVDCGSTCPGGTTCGAFEPNVCNAILGPVADAFVRLGQPNSNFGADPSVLVKRQDNDTDNNRRAYLRFDISGVASVSKAKLRLWGSRPANSTAAAFAVDNTTWVEGTGTVAVPTTTGITWNNKPGTGDQQGNNVTITPTLRYYEFDVTDWVSTQKGMSKPLVSVAILPQESNSAAPATFESKEGTTGHPPALIITP
jgi:hypothetical protein